MGRAVPAWWGWLLMACLVHVAAPARKHNPGHYLRLFDIPELCPHLSFVMPWTLQQGEKEVVFFRQGSLSIREQNSNTEKSSKNIPVIEIHIVLL